MKESDMGIAKINSTYLLYYFWFCFSLINASSFYEYKTALYDEKGNYFLQANPSNNSIAVVNNNQAALSWHIGPAHDRANLGWFLYTKKDDGSTYYLTADDASEKVLLAKEKAAATVFYIIKNGRYIKLKTKQDKVLAVGQKGGASEPSVYLTQEIDKHSTNFLPSSLALQEAPRLEAYPVINWKSPYLSYLVRIRENENNALAYSDSGSLRMKSLLQSIDASQFLWRIEMERIMVGEKLYNALLLAHNDLNKYLKIDDTQEYSFTDNKEEATRWGVEVYSSNDQVTTSLPPQEVITLLRLHDQHHDKVEHMYLSTNDEDKRLKLTTTPTKFMIEVIRSIS